MCLGLRVRFVLVRRPLGGDGRYAVRDRDSLQPEVGATSKHQLSENLCVHIFSHVCVCPFVCLRICASVCVE